METAAPRLTLVAVILVVAFGMPSLADEATADQRFLAGLRERQLFELARTWCVERLQAPDLSQQRRSELTIALSLSLADWALNSPPEEREALWRASWQAAEDFLKRYPNAPGAVLVRFQAALGFLARGELARQEAEVVADNATLLEEARTWLREAIGALGDLDQRLADEVRRRSDPGGATPPAGPPHPFSSYQLASIGKNVKYELALALRNQGQSYPPESADRANSLTQAIALLEPLATLDPNHPLAWKSRVDEIVCHRLLGDFAAAGRNLDALVAADPPPDVLPRARAEKIRLALAENRLEDAIAVLAAGREADQCTSGDLDYARVETYLAAWRAAVAANDTAAAKQWQTQTSEMVRRIEQQHGPYWTRRAEMLLAGYVRSAGDAGDPAMQEHAAESSYRSGRIDDALAAYDRAAASARARGDSARAFDLGYVAATIEHQRSRHSEAMERYRRLAMEMPAQPKAAETHALAIYHASQLAKNSPEALVRYVELIEEHLRTWPQAASADGVRRRLGNLREHQQDWKGAIAAYRDISPADARRVEAVEAAVRCYEAWLARRRAAGERTEEIAGEAADWLESIVLGPDRRLPERYSPVAQTAVLAAARLLLNETQTGFTRAERLLSAAIAGATDAPAAWQTAARSLLVFALAGQGRHREASEALEQLSAGSPRELLALVRGLSRVAATARPEVKAGLANLRLAAIERLQVQGQQFSPDDQRSLDFARAQALNDAGRGREAAEALARLAGQYPRDGEIQEAYAQQMLGGEDPASLEKALAKWREVEAKAPLASERWFRAKYEVAALHYRLGNREQTAKMIQLLEILHPDLGGPELKRRFLDLLAEAKR